MRRSRLYIYFCRLFSDNLLFIYFNFYPQQPPTHIYLTKSCCCNITRVDGDDIVCNRGKPQVSLQQVRVCPFCRAALAGGLHYENNWNCKGHHRPISDQQQRYIYYFTNAFQSNCFTLDQSMFEALDQLNIV